MKKFIIVLLTICTLFTSVSVFADTDPSSYVNSVTFDSTEKTITVSCDETYMSAITGFKLSDWDCNIDDGGIFPDGQGKTSTGFTFPTVNGTGNITGMYDFVIYATGYNNYETRVFIGDGDIKPLPEDLSLSVKENGDFIIYSEDTDFMQAVVASYEEEDPEMLEGIVYSQEKTGWFDYYFGVHNYTGERTRTFMPLEYDRDNDVVVFSVASQ